jgi:hypothetical protein
MVASTLEAGAVQIVKSLGLAEDFDSVIRFVVAGKEPQFLLIFRQNGRGLFEPTAPICQVSGGCVYIGRLIHQRFERGPVFMNIGKDEQFH